ncbi:hypothetical protein V6N13_061312 [Hibiscus sabdariffa]
MHFPLSWRWPRWWWVCYAWCTLRIPLGAALRFSVPRGGASLVQLASSMRDCIGSPRLEPGSLLPRLGFHPTSEGYSVGNLVKWLSIGSPQCPACCCTAGALFIALCGARPRPSLEALFALVRRKLPWPPFASVWPNTSVAYSNPSLLLGNRPALSANPRLRPPGCALHSTNGAFVPRWRCPSCRLVAYCWSKPKDQS